MNYSDQVRKIIAEKLGVDISRVIDDARFVDDLGADSLDQVELVMELESSFDCEIPDDVAQKITTVKSAIDFVEEVQSKKS